MTLALRTFGQTGLKIPPLVFGATSLGNLFREVPEAEKSAIVAAWMGSGLSPVVIDSAGKYGAGLSLEVIGRELQRLRVQPGSVLVSNKLAWRRVPLQGDEPTFEPGAWFGLKHDAVQDISYDGILRCLREGNELLLGHAAQLVSVHDPDEYLAAAQGPEDRETRLQDLVSAYQALRDLKTQGEVAAVGVGAKNWQTIQELDGLCEFDWIMFANSFTLMHHPAELIRFLDTLAERKIAVINSALFHGGFLLGGDFFDYRRVDQQNAGDRKRLDWRDRFHAVCKRMNVSPFQIGVAFGLAHPAVTAVALSSSRADRVAQHIQAVSQQISTEVWNALAEQQLIGPDLDFLQGASRKEI